MTERPLPARRPAPDAVATTPAAPAVPAVGRSAEPPSKPHRHPSLGLPPVDMTAGAPAAAARLRASRGRVAARALEVAIELDPSIATRYDELGLRRLLHDSEVLLEQLCRSLASGESRFLREHARSATPIYRRRKVPMADLMTLCEGMRDAAGASLEPGEQALLDEALDAAIAVFHWNGRLAGDAKKRNPIIRFFYRGV